MIKEQVLEYIKKGKPIGDIQYLLHIENQEYLQILKEIRAECKLGVPSVSNNGTYFFKSQNKKKRINLIPAKRKIRALITSDTHIGSVFDRPELMEQVYKYMEDEGIHIILLPGDIVEGTYTNPKQISEHTLEAQGEKVIKTYPFSRNIITLFIGGNHDHHNLIDNPNQFDVCQFIAENRTDMIFLGYGMGTIHICNDILTLQHNLSNKKAIQVYNGSGIIIRGHSHRMKFEETQNGQLIINSPALSDADPGSYPYQAQKGFIDATFQLNDEGLIQMIESKQFVLNDKPQYVATLKLTNHTIPNI